ncbi:hypothetical protein [Hymenobacter sp. BT559]|uniref:hypothetical protein n=1 Tax=Hymenobacter sp. BT559 TaxID=2795729 RepID=UPI0018EDB178|nr:hypothetical protein [Hymenobacter sp. BT559]MBJ6142650.1 hypothetical protein [Hymenobacter sp. BT559]
MVLRQMIRFILSGFQVFNKVVLSIAVAVLFGGMLWLTKKFIEIPDVLISIKEQMIQNPAFISKIGEYNGFAIWYDEELAAKKSSVPFSVSIKGKGDAAYVKIVGYYTIKRDGGVDCVKTDTLYSRQEK